MTARSEAVQKAAERLTEAQHVSREVGGRAAQRELDAALTDLQKLAGTRAIR